MLHVLTQLFSGLGACPSSLSMKLHVLTQSFSQLGARPSSLLMVLHCVTCTDTIVFWVGGMSFFPLNRVTLCYMYCHSCFLGRGHVFLPS